MPDSDRQEPASFDAFLAATERAIAQGIRLIAASVPRTETFPPTPAEEPPTERPWWDAANRWYHTWAKDYPDRAKHPIAAVLELLSVIAMEPEQREVPLVEVVSRLILVIDGARIDGDTWADDPSEHLVWNQRRFLERSPITALLAALGSDPYGNGNPALRRVRNTAATWLSLIERGAL